VDNLEAVVHMDNPEAQDHQERVVNLETVITEALDHHKQDMEIIHQEAVVQDNLEALVLLERVGNLEVVVHMDNLEALVLLEVATAEAPDHLEVGTMEHHQE